MSEAETDSFIRANTQLVAPPLVPEILLHLATEMTPLWRATQAALDGTELAPPYWAFAWPGGQALARFLIDRPGLVRRKRVFVFAAGSGIDAIAAAQAGAAHVTACDIDPYAHAAMRLNAAENGVALTVSAEDPLELPPPDADLVIAGDVFYEEAMGRRAQAWLRRCAAAGLATRIADPGRSYLPYEELVALKSYDVPTSRDLEDATTKRVTIYREADTGAANSDSVLSRKILRRSASVRKSQ